MYDHLLQTLNIMVTLMLCDILCAFHEGPSFKTSKFLKNSGVLASTYLVGTQTQKNAEYSIYLSLFFL